METRSKENLKILYLLTDSDFGGTETSVLHLMRGLHSRGYNVSLCSIKRPGNMAGEAAAHGIKVTSLNMPSTIGFSYPFLILPALFKWKRILAEEDPDLLHSFLLQANLLCAFTRVLYKPHKRCVAYIHSLRCMERKKPLWRIILDRWALRKSDLIISVSDAVRRLYIQRERIRPSKIRVLYHGVEPRLFSIDGHHLDAFEKTGPSIKGCQYSKTDDSECERVIGTVTRLHPDKGIETLLEGIACVIQKVPDKIRFIIIGDGPKKGALMKLSSELGIKDKGIFTGFQPDVTRWLFCFNIFCLTSKEEGLPQSVLEAMALGIPVIATDVGGVGEVIEDNKTGILIPPEDPGALSSAILCLLRNPEKARQMAQTGREMLKKRFLIDYTLNEIEEIYRGLQAQDLSVTSSVKRD